MAATLASAFVKESQAKGKERRQMRRQKRAGGKRAEGAERRAANTHARHEIKLNQESGMLDVAHNTWHVTRGT